VFSTFKHYFKVCKKCAKKKLGSDRWLHAYHIRIWLFKCRFYNNPWSMKVASFINLIGMKKRPFWSSDFHNSQGNNHLVRWPIKTKPRVKKNLIAPVFKSSSSCFLTIGHVQQVFQVKFLLHLRPKELGGRHLIKQNNIWVLNQVTENNYFQFLFLKSTIILWHNNTLVSVLTRMVRLHLPNLNELKLFKIKLYLGDITFFVFFLALQTSEPSSEITSRNKEKSLIMSQQERKLYAYIDWTNQTWIAVMVTTRYCPIRKN